MRKNVKKGRSEEGGKFRNGEEDKEKRNRDEFVRNKNKQNICEYSPCVYIYKYRIY